MGVITNIKTGLRLRNTYLVWKVLKNIENWPLYFLDFFSLTRKKHIIYHMRNGQKYFVRAKTCDRGIMTAICLSDEYGINQLSLKHNFVVIDIGANIGAFTVCISGRAKRIFAYEPVLDNFSVLLENIRINNLRKIVNAFNIAVSGRKEKLNIYFSKDNSAMHSAYGKGKQYVTVESTTLKEIFDTNGIERCDLLKIDTEGCEYNILYALPDNYFKRIKMIYLEYHNIDKFTFNSINHIYNDVALRNFLESKGFKITCKLYYFFAKRIEEK